MVDNVIKFPSGPEEPVDFPLPCDPPKPWRTEWFITEMDGGKVGLRAFYEEDKRWVPFPDSAIVPAAAVRSSPQEKP